ncbi:S8 family peptidase [Shewanella xiamenensis]|uniref:S8 family peptidase n=1 Tax=Shewanella xiamenensis TaxID=332186 RepID=UPI00313ADDFC
MAENRNPIKHINFSEVDFFKPKVNARRDNKPLKEVTEEFRTELLNSIESLKTVEGFSSSVTVAVVEVEANAVAKSHRPTDIFNEKTCPFFGDIGYSKFLIQVTPLGLSKLSERISIGKAKTTIKALSTIKSIEKYNVVLNVGEKPDFLSVRLFRYNSEALNNKLDAEFELLLSNNNCTWIKHSSNAVRLYRISINSKSILELLPKFAGIQSVMSSRCIQLKPMVKATMGIKSPNFFPPIPGQSYPVVAVVDSGVSANFLPLSHWIVGRESCIAPNYKIDEHGTFVSGLICNAFNLNGFDSRFPNCQSKIFSVEVLGTDGGDLYSIIQTMHDVAKTHPEIKVWNLSLGGASPVSKSEISTMALMLDEFQDKYGCLCVVAAGNYEKSIREWPPIMELEDGVSTPGDSVRALTVGSIAHVDGFVKSNEPSSFSRKGPVSNYVQKPEVVHFGGNILMNGGQPIVLGVNSIDIDGNSHHDIGTSFSTPIVSSIAANLFAKIGERATPSLVKALIIHSANLNHDIPEIYKSYYGWGKPQNSDDILSVKDYESTMVFEGLAQKSFEIQKLPFPIPNCLRTDEGKVRAEFFITLVYQPELDPQRAFEYCQMDVKVGFGKVIEGKFTSLVPLQSESYLFESDLVKNGDKWSPVKVYKKSFTEGVNIQDWKLRVSVMDRDGYDAVGVLIPFSIVLTIRDIDKMQPVYNEMALLMDQYNWEVTNLELNTQIQV